MKKFLGVLVLAALIPVSAHANYTSTINATMSVWKVLTVGSTMMVFPTIASDHNLSGAPIATSNSHGVTGAQTNSDFTTGNNGAVNGSDGSITVSGGQANASVKIASGPSLMMIGALQVSLFYDLGIATSLDSLGSISFPVVGRISSGTPTPGSYLGTSTDFTIAYN